MSTSPARPLILVGLGNPGNEYASTYHNIGAIFIEYIAKKEGLSLAVPGRKHFAYAKSNHGILVIPQSFMNTSGGPVKEALAFFEATPEQLMLVHDDTDLLIGTYKFVRGGGSAGHHGVESVIGAMGNPEFCRLRIGVRDPNEIDRKKAGDLVLEQITKADLATLYGAFEAIMTNVTENETPFSSVFIS